MPYKEKVLGQGCAGRSYRWHCGLNVPQYVEVLTPGTCECDLFWKQGFEM